MYQQHVARAGLGGALIAVHDYVAVVLDRLSHARRRQVHVSVRAALQSQL